MSNKRNSNTSGTTSANTSVYYKEEAKEFKFKMRVLETRQVTDEVLVLAWSPRSDLVALGLKHGEIVLHRLSWQKVWQTSIVSKDSPDKISEIIWHPEGIFVVVTCGCSAYILDVESGKIIQEHELRVKINSTRWCHSKYDLSMNEILATQARQQSDFLRNDLKIQRLESHLSVLLIGACNNEVRVYTGGFLLALCIKLPETFKNVSQVDVTTDLESFRFVAKQEENEDEKFFTFCHLRNEVLPKMASVIGPLGFKYIFFMKNWSLIQNELLSLNEHWAKLYDLYIHYVTYASSGDSEEIRADFMELLFTGVCSVEMEIFLGGIGREKEAKKNVTLINTTSSSIADHLRSIKCALIFMLTELNEICGFLLQISGYKAAQEIITEMRKSFAYLYVSTLHIQRLVRNFVDVSLHFMHVIMNTVHLFNLQEVQDFIEEDADTDKVLEFLHIDVKRDIFEFLLANVTIGIEERPHAKDIGGIGYTKTSMIGSTSVFTRPENFLIHFDEGFSKKKENLQSSEDISSGEGQWEYFPDFCDKWSKSHHKVFSHNLLLDFSVEKTTDFLLNLVPAITKLNEELLRIPVLCTVPLKLSSYPLIPLPNEKSTATNEKVTHILSPNNTAMLTNQLTRKSFVTLQCDPCKVYLFEIQFSSSASGIAKCYCLKFSREIMSVKFFTEEHLSILSYDGEDKKNDTDEFGRSILCQVAYTNLVSSHTLSLNSDKLPSESSNPNDINIQIPTQIVKPSVVSSGNIVYALPLDGFSSCDMAVSGSRKVGCVVSENKQTLVLVEMENKRSDEEDDDEEEDDEDETVEFEDGENNSE